MAKAGLFFASNPSVKTDGNTDKFNLKVKRLYIVVPEKRKKFKEIRKKGVIFGEN
jgi:hypothetical protein